MNCLRKVIARSGDIILAGRLFAPQCPSP
jgi:hypothetical protein